MKELRCQRATPRPQEASETLRLKAEETAREDAEQKDAEQI